MWLQYGIINFDDSYFESHFLVDGNIYLTANLFVSFILKFTASLLGSKVQLAPPTGKHNGRANSEIGYSIGGLEKLAWIHVQKVKPVHKSKIVKFNGWWNFFKIGTQPSALFPLPLKWDTTEYPPAVASWGRETKNKIWNNCFLFKTKIYSFRSMISFLRRCCLCKILVRKFTATTDVLQLT